MYHTNTHITLNTRSLSILLSISQNRSSDCFGLKLMDKRAMVCLADGGSGDEVKANINARKAAATNMYHLNNQHKFISSVRYQHLLLSKPLSLAAFLINFFCSQQRGWPRDMQRIF